MIKVDEAIEFAVSHFPKGPEALAAHLGIKVYVCALGKTEGWCIRARDQAVIRVNSLLPEVRQRFTLAHELGHLLMGTDHIIHRTLDDLFRGSNESEIIANQIAAELLLPSQIVKQHVHSIPLDRRGLDNLAKAANISGIIAAIRIAGMSEHLGLISACVLGFKDHQPAWCPVKAFAGVKILGKQAMAVLKSKSTPVFRGKDGEYDVFAFRLKDQKSTLFIQRLTPGAARQKTYDELKREHEYSLYASYPSLRHSVEGCLSTFRSRSKKISEGAEDALIAFMENYKDKWNPEFTSRLFSPSGQAYLKMRLSSWYTPRLISNTGSTEL